MRYYFNPVTALAIVSGGGKFLGGQQKAQQDVDNAEAEIADVKSRITAERVSEARELRDLEADSEQNIALLKARAAAGGGNLSDVGFQLRSRRELKETAISRGRIKEDADFNVSSLLRLSGNIAKQGASKSRISATKGVLGGISSLRDIFG